MSKEKIKQTFSRLNKNNDKAFISYIMGGDGGLDQLKNQIQLLQDSGVDVIEIGIPFSDPVADGPVIQEAALRALSDNVSLRDILNQLKEIKDEVHVPLVIMTYINPLLTLGYEAFSKEAAEAGVSGVIIPDVPYEEEDEIKDYLTDADIALIRLITLTSDEERIKTLTKDAEGFIYAVTVKGTTGGRVEYGEDTYALLEKIKSVSDVPVCAGFGVSSREMAEKLSRHTDGVIVGSKIVDLLHQKKFDDIKHLIPEKTTS
ncbi:tryptophan synthase subunit alpha [Corticicoccus populi]|uniref:Tryptophan synthase alpha chain n=1 Tax=Corticicoccus populi TaxID=1812821 RepID=A0ABW5WUM0_9STAP